MAIKSQALMEFMVKWTETQLPPTPVTRENWSMYFDGCFTLNGATGGIVLISPKGDQLLYMIGLHYRATNNVAEYEALINGLRFTAELGVQWLYILPDSELVINQVIGCQTIVTPAWWHTNKRSESLRRSSMVSNFIISSSETMKCIHVGPVQAVHPA
jgi:ribonuclease HI